MRAWMFGVVVMGSEWAFAAPTCTADPAGKSITVCLVEVDPGGEVLLKSGAVYEVPSLVIRKDVRIRAITPSSRAILVHKPLDLVRVPVFESAYPIVVGAAVQAGGGAEVTLTDIEIRPFLRDTELGTVHLGRAVEVSGGAQVRLEGVLVENVTAPKKGSPSSLPGGYGGHVTGVGSTLTVVDSEFRNIVAAEHMGGAFYADGGGTIEILGRTTIEANQAYKGGGALARFGGTVVVDRAGDVPHFVNNRGSSSGGAIAVERSESSLRIVEGIFEGNTATSWGGHVLVYDATLTIGSATFENGSAGQGGAMYLWSATADIAGATFVGNRAGAAGGAIGAESSDVRLDTVHFDDNAASSVSSFGGALGQTGGDLTLRAASFTQNTADSGGALSLRDVATVDVSVASFVDNVARASGGAVWSIGTRGTESFWWNQFCGNQAPQGSALGLVSQGSTLRRLEFTNNLIDGYAAGMSEAMRVEWRDFQIDQNNFVRGEGRALTTSAASGSFRRNLVAWQGALSAIDAQEGTVPGLVENAFWDPGSRWGSPVTLLGAPVSAGTDPVFEDPTLTGAFTGSLPVPCATAHHHLRPDSPLLLAAWDTSAARYEQIGMFGGPSSPSDPWIVDADADGVVAYWDCDEADGSLGMRLEQYYDSDGDGYTDMLWDRTWPCTLLPGNTLTPECTPADDWCQGDSDDPTGAEPTYWYGGCDVGAGTLGWGALALALLPFRRRRAR